MKTILQIAREIGVSKQAVFYRIKKPPLSNELKNLISKEKGVLMVSFDGETLIKREFKAETVKIFDDKKASNENANFDGELIHILKENLSILQEQLKFKDKQIEELTETIKIQAESINATHKNELAETIIDGHKTVSELSDTNNKFWKILNSFRKNRGQR